MWREADNRRSGLVLERALRPRWLFVVGRVGVAVVDALDCGGERGERYSEASSSEIASEEGGKEDKGILRGKRA